MLFLTVGRNVGYRTSYVHLRSWCSVRRQQIASAHPVTKRAGGLHFYFTYTHRLNFTRTCAFITLAINCLLSMGTRSGNFSVNKCTDKNEKSRGSVRLQAISRFRLSICTGKKLPMHIPELSVKFHLCFRLYDSIKNRHYNLHFEYKDVSRFMAGMADLVGLCCQS